MKMRGGILFLVGLVLAAGSLSAENLISVTNADKKWQYIDHQGAVKIPGPFDMADDFSEGLGRVKTLDGQTAFVDETGKIVFTVKADYRSTAGFSEGRAWFVRDGMMGFLDKSGQEIIPPHFVPEAGRQEGSFAPVYFNQGKAAARLPVEGGWVKPDGTYVKSPRPLNYDGLPLGADFQGLTPFSEGITVFPEGKLFGMMDSDGRTTAPAAWDELRPLTEGLAAARKDKLWGFVDKRGKEVVPFQFSEAFAYQGGAAVVVKDGKYTLCDAQGKLLAGPGYDDLSPAGAPDGTPVSDKSKHFWTYSKGDKKGLIDGNGRVVTEAKYDTIYSYFGTTALVVQGEKHGLLDGTGREILPCTYDQLGYMGEGLSAFRSGEKWGYVDKTGKVVIEPQYQWAGDFTGGLAAVVKEGKGGLIDKTGKAVTAFIYDGIHNLQEGRRLFTRDGKCGFMDTGGKEVLPPVYDEAQDFCNGAAAVQENRTVRLIDPQGKTFKTLEGFSSVAVPAAGEPLLTARGGKVGFIGPDGKYNVPAIFERAVVFNDGVGLVGQVTSQGGRWLYVDAQGQVLFKEANWRPYNAFSKNRAFVLLEVKPNKTLSLAMIDEKGQVLASGITNQMGGFTEGPACVQFEDGQWGYLNPDGQRAFGKVWESAFPFSEGLAAVKVDGLIGFINTKGEMVIPPAYDRVSGFHDGVAWAADKTGESYINTQGKAFWKDKAQ